MRADFGHSEEEHLGRPADVRLLRRLAPFARPYIAQVGMAIALVATITILELALPWVTKITIDRYIVPDRAVRHATVESALAGTARVDVSPENAGGGTLGQPASAIDGLSRMALLLLGVVFAAFIAEFAQMLVLEWTGQRIMHDIRMHLFGHIQRLAMPYFTNNPVGRITTRLTNDIQNMNELFTSVLSVVFKDSAMLIGIAGALLIMNWRLALITFGVLPPVVLTAVYFANRAREVFRDQRILVAQINTRFAETIEGIAIIQLFGQAADNFIRFARLNRKNFDAGMQQIHVFAVFMPVIEVLSAVALAIVIYFGGGRVVSDRLTLGELVAFISYVRMFFRPIRDIAEKYNVLQNAMASAERIFQILDNHQMDMAAGAPEGATPSVAFRFSHLALDQVAFAYDPSSPVLRSVSADLPAGRSMAIVGPTGAGKSTLIQLIQGFYAPTEGQIRFNHRPMADWDLLSLRRAMAVVPQEPFLFSDTVRANICMRMTQLSESRLADVIDAARCTSLIAALPQGLDTVMAEGGRTLSSGQRQLIAIARALAQDPELIILDEATSHIDSNTEQLLQAAMANLMDGRSAIVVAHRLSTARHADTILVLHNGRVLETGDHDTLMAAQGYYCRMTRLAG